MPKITRYRHERRGNVKAAPEFLTPDVVGRLVGFVNGAVHAPCPFEEAEAIREELERYGDSSLAEIPESITEPQFDLTETGKAFLESQMDFPPVHFDCQRRCLPEVQHVLIPNIFPLEASVTKPVQHGDAKPQPAVRTDSRSGPEAGSEEARRRPSRQPRKKSSSSVPERIAETAPEAQITPPDAVTPIKNGYDTRSPEEISQNISGASGTARKASSAASSGATSRQCGKTASRDWFIRRHEALADAVRFLKARCILVDVVDRDDQIRRYRISGKRDSVYLEGVVEYAEHLGFEAAR